MHIGEIYSHFGGEAFIKDRYMAELQEVINAISAVSGPQVLTKISEEKTKPSLIFSPEALNKSIKGYLAPLGWTTPSEGKKGFTEPRLYWNSSRDDFHDHIGMKTKGENEFREMDGLKNQVGLEIQFGKYAFMGYDIFSKMPIFAKRGLITCGIEVVAMPHLVQNMSTGVSSFTQIVMDMKARGVSNLDIPTLILGIDCSPNEWSAVASKRERFLHHREEMIASGEVSAGRKGAKPGPK